MLVAASTSPEFLELRVIFLLRRYFTLTVTGIFLLVLYFRKYLHFLNGKPKMNLFSCLVSILGACAAFAMSFNEDEAERTVWLSAAAYCPKSSYDSREFKGPTAGFVVTKTLYDGKSDMQGYIGYLPSDESIYVTFRGSSSVRNWIENLDVIKTSYTSYPECNCKVHKGFYQTEQALIGEVIDEVKGLQQKYPSYSVKVTGHSLGAAVAQLTGMDLLKANVSTTMYNIGQPRVGDQTYATFAGNKLPQIRITHNKDVVVHIPPSMGMDFVHSCTEEFENESGALKTCTDSSCEDPSCADQYELKDTNVDDHLIYLGMDVSCEAAS